MPNVKASASSPDAVVQVSALTRKFGDLIAVGQVTLAIYRGEIFGLIGPNSAGKSTLIKMLTTLLPPSSGTATIALVVRGLLRVPIGGSIPLFLAGTALYLFFASSIGIFLGTVARSMPQLGLLYLLVYLPMAMLSGSNTPLESMPPWLGTLLKASPAVHFVSFAQAILYRGAGFAVVWREFIFVALMGGLFLWLALLRFRKVMAATVSV